MTWLLLAALADVSVATPGKNRLEYIVPAERAAPFYEATSERFWTPSVATVDALRPKLARFLKTQKDVQELNQYARRYLGVMVKGRKRIWIYGFNANDLKSYRIDDAGTDVDDGGCGYWRVYFDVATGKFSGFGCNGEG